MKSYKKQTQVILERVQDTKLTYKSQFPSCVSERTSGIWNLNHFILCISLIVFHSFKKWIQKFSKKNSKNEILSHKSDKIYTRFTWGQQEPLRMKWKKN